MNKINHKEEFFKVLSVVLSVFLFILIVTLVSITLDKTQTGEKINLTNNDTNLNSNTHVIIQTNLGDIEIELYEKEAPITTKNFLNYVESNFYNGTIFHRVIDGFMIQGGGFLANGTQKETNAPIELESYNGLENKMGTIAMARTQNPNSATSQFFINVADNNFLNYKDYNNPGYAVFGEVVNGMDIVNKIKSVQTENKSPYLQNWPIKDVIITGVYILNPAN